MSIYKDENGVEHHITHTMADGRILESVKGYPVPENHPAYDVLAKIRMNHCKTRR